MKDDDKQTESDRVAVHVREHHRIEVRSAFDGGAVEVVAEAYQHGVCLRLPPKQARDLAADLFVAAWLNGDRDWSPYPKSLSLDEIIAARDRVRKASRG